MGSVVSGFLYLMGAIPFFPRTPGTFHGEIRMLQFKPGIYESRIYSVLFVCSLVGPLRLVLLCHDVLQELCFYVVWIVYNIHVQGRG